MVDQNPRIRVYGLGELPDLHKQNSISIHDMTRAALRRAHDELQTARCQSIETINDSLRELGVNVPQLQVSEATKQHHPAQQAYFE